jgi:hypothetical protein
VMASLWIMAFLPKARVLLGARDICGGSLADPGARRHGK